MTYGLYMHKHLKFRFNVMIYRRGALCLLLCYAVLVEAQDQWLAKLERVINSSRPALDSDGDGLSAAGLLDSVGCDFHCGAITATTAKTVHQLSPSAVKVVAALGDSITAALGAKARTILTALVEYRGVSWSIGGDGDLTTVATMPNVLKQYNKAIKGFSIATGAENTPDAKFNQAVSGAVSQSLPGQAEALISLIQSDASVDFEQDWKVVTIWIGGNDLCAYCENATQYSPESYVFNIQKTLDILHAKLPRTFVNLVQILDVTLLSPLSSVWCDLIHSVVCRCATTGSSEDKQITSEASHGYQRAVQQLINSGRYDNKDDFTVVLQPFASGIKLPYTDGEPDKSYFAPDCFHFSTKGHKEMAVALWNNMMEPEGQKTLGWILDQPLKCPNENAPYFYTKKNSPAVAGAAGGFGVSSADSGGQSGQNGSNVLPVILGVGIGAGLLVLVAVGVVVGVVIRKRRQRKEGERIPLVYKKSTDM